MNLVVRAGCKVAIAASIVVLAAMPAPALAWGEPGHQIIGSIADQIISADDPEAAANLHAALGSVSLSVATTWADCVRDVHETGGQFSYEASAKYTPKVCSHFQTPDEEARMVDYASRNWTNCVYVGGGECHGAYHFADVAIQEDHYDRAFVGTSDHDVVSAINAAIQVMEGNPSPAPFSIKSKREALFLLAHFVGDIHQPLHVGAIYLDASGQVMDPDAAHLSTDYCVAGPRTYCTVGGNHIMTGAMTNLHAEWDDIASSYGETAALALVKAARQTPASSGDVSGWAAAWASDTIVQAQKAFQGITYSQSTAGSDGANRWNAVFANRTSYTKARGALQKAQLEKAGARLAQLLEVLCHTSCAD